MFSGGPFAFDLTFSHWLQTFQDDRLTSAMKIFSFLGEPLLYTPLFLLLAAWWFAKGKQSLAILIVVILAGHLLSLGLKELFDRPRPTADVVTIIQSGSSSSFPSGHALGAVLIGGLGMYLSHLGNRAKGFWTFVCLIFIFGVGLSRIYLGAHWLSDVLGGYVVALFWLLIVFWLFWPKIRLRMVQAEKSSIEVVP